MFFKEKMSSLLKKEKHSKDNCVVFPGCQEEKPGNLSAYSKTDELDTSVYESAIDKGADSPQLSSYEPDSDLQSHFTIKSLWENVKELTTDVIKLWGNANNSCKDFSRVSFYGKILGTSFLFLFISLIGAILYDTYNILCMAILVFVLGAIYVLHTEWSYKKGAYIFCYLFCENETSNSFPGKKTAKYQMHGFVDETKEEIRLTLNRPVNGNIIVGGLYTMVFKAQNAAQCSDCNLQFWNSISNLPEDFR